VSGGANTGGAVSVRTETARTGTAQTGTRPDWAALAAGRSPYQSPQWYRAAGWLPRTRLLTAGRAAVPVWLLDRAGREHYFHDPIRLITGEREKPFLDGAQSLVEQALRCTSQATVLVTMSPYGYRGGALATGAGPDDLRALADRLLEYAAQVGASMVASHYLFDDDDGPWLAALAAAGGLRVLVGADAQLDIAWDSMADYWRWLPSSRRSLRHGRNVPDDELVWQVREEPGLPATHAAVPDLLAGASASFDSEAPAPQSLLRTVAYGQALPRTVLSVAEPGRRPRSAAVVLRGPQSLYAKFFGSAAPRADYLPLAYPRLIGYAIDRRFRRIEYGGGSHHAKLLRGARLRPGWGVLFVLDHRLRGSVESLARRVSFRKLAYFAALARDWQVRSLPVHPAFAAGGAGSSRGGDR
jgi:hypothetical protein